MRGSNQKVKCVHEKTGEVRHFTQQAINLGGPRRNGYFPEGTRTTKKTPAAVQASEDEFEMPEITVEGGDDTETAPKRKYTKRK